MARRKKANDEQLGLFSILDETVTDVSGETSTVTRLVAAEGLENPPSQTAADEQALAQSDPRPESSQEPETLEPVQVITDLKAAGAGDYEDYAGQPITLTDDILPPRSPQARADANIAAIRTLHTLTAEKRWANPEEQHTLAQYSAWGACSQIFDRTDTAWADRRSQLEELVDDATFHALARTTLTAYYTPPEVIDAMWEGLRDAGLTTGRVLEPGSGIGGFIRKANDTAQMVGVETDPIAAGIAKQLYPQADIHQAGFEKLTVPDNTFSAAIGNVPFGDIVLNDRHHNPNGFSIHNHFITKSLDAVKPGGYVAVLTSSYTSDAAKSGARAAMIDRADLVSAMRLPSQTFREVAGTDVTADLLVFRVREPGQEPTDPSKQWLATATYRHEDGNIRVNETFEQFPERILGTPQISTGRFGQPVLTVSPEDGDLKERIVEIIRADLEEIRAEGRDFTTEQEDGDMAPLEVAGLEDSPIPGTVRYHENDAGDVVFEEHSVTKGWVELKLPRGVKADEWKSLLDMRDTTVALRQANTDGDQEQADQLRSRLNKQYDAYYETYGAVNRVEEKTRKPNKAAQQSAFDELERVWRVDERWPMEEPLPEEVEQELREQAAQPKTVTVQRHLAKLTADPYLSQLLAIESYDNDTGVASKNAIFTTSPAGQIQTVDHADTIRDAVAISLNRHGEIDPALVADLLGDDQQIVEERLVEQKLAFRDPENPEAFIRANIYASGRVKDKLATAREIAQTDERFKPNVEALKAAIPERVESGIHVTPGANWVPTEYYAQFAAEKFGYPDSRLRVTRTDDTWHVEVDKQWWNFGGKADLEYGVVCANNKAGGSFNFQARGTRAHERNQAVATQRNDGVAVPAFEMYENVLNLASRGLNHSKEYLEEHPTASNRHDEASEFAARKAAQLRNEFSSWVMEDAERRADIIDRYNDAFNSYVATKWDGSYREIPNLGEKFDPYDYQKNAVERMTNQPAVLLNHVVGAGKTGTFFMGAAELKRLGKIQQPWIVVPNHLVEQITSEANQWYPEAEVLSSAGVSSPEERRTFVAQTTAKDWDFVIVSQSVFERIPMSEENQRAYIEAQLNEAREELNAQKAVDPQSISVKEMERAVQRMETRMAKLVDTPRDTGLPFEATPCDYLIVDEAHLYKNLQRTSRVEDISHPGSNRASDLDMKLNYLRDTRAERGQSETAPVVTFATGTPVANNLAEIWVMARYLRPDLLEQAGVDRINAWAATFTEAESVFEVNSTGSGLKQVTRTASYINLPELAAINGNFQDVVKREHITAKLPEMVDDVVQFEAENDVKDFIADLGWREMQKWEGYSNVVPPAAIDNPVKALSDAKKVTLHPRLANVDIDGPGERVRHVADNVYETWEQGKDDVYLDDSGNESPITGGFQIIFCDAGVPGKNAFSVYGAIRDELVARGMERDSIQFIHDWDKDRRGLYQRCRSGQVSVLIGSTQKLGTGANIQTRCQAIHHVDVPWRPADNEQRDGRGWRQGNQNEQVKRVRYISAGTTDAVAWQKIHSKSVFIDQLNQGSDALQRKVGSIDDSQAESAGHLKAIATGDPRYMELEELGKRVRELEGERADWLAGENNARETLRITRLMHDENQEFVTGAEQALGACQRWADSDKRTWTLDSGTTVDDRSTAAKAISRAAFEVFRSKDKTEKPIATIGGLEFTGRYSAVHSSAVISARNIPHSREVKLDFEAFETELSGPQGADDPASAKQYGTLSRLENQVTRLEKDTAKAKAHMEEQREEIERLENRAAGVFESEGELQDIAARRDRLQAELVAFENSPEYQRRGQEREERKAFYGRKDGWTLERNPTNAYAGVVRGKSRAELIADARTRDVRALQGAGHLTESEAERRILQIREEVGLTGPDEEPASPPEKDTPQQPAEDKQPEVVSQGQPDAAQSSGGDVAPTAKSAFDFVAGQGLLDPTRPVVNGQSSDSQSADDSTQHYQQRDEDENDSGCDL